MRGLTLVLLSMTPAVIVVIAAPGCVRAGFEVLGHGGRGDDRAGAEAGQIDGRTRDNADGPKQDVAARLDVAAKRDGPAKPDGPAKGSAVPGTWVSAGKGAFSMGSPASEPCRDTDEDQHQVTLTHDFELNDTNVTQGEFQAVMGYNPSFFTSCGPSCPVETVTWHEAAAYCNALSPKAGYAACYQCTGTGKNVSCSEAAAYSGQNVYACPGYRLLTEAEREYAERAGTTTAYYSGANDGAKCSTCAALDANADTIGWYCANSGGSPHPVKGKQPNAWGLYDLAGNVWEWCHDGYQNNLGVTPVVDPWGGAPGSARMMRGGSFAPNNFASFMRAADRHGAPSTTRVGDVGFRCGRTR